TSASLLNKLLEVQHYPVALAQLSHFRSLPGLELLVVDPGCNAARHVLIGGIARIAGDTDDTRIRGALARLLEALVTFDTQPLRIHAQIMIASLFWELLEYNENALSNMLVGQAQIKAL